MFLDLILGFFSQMRDFLGLTLLELFLGFSWCFKEIKTVSLKEIQEKVENIIDIDSIYCLKVFFLLACIIGNK